MKPIHFAEMKKGKLYYIESNANNTDRQIARFKDFKHIYNDMYIINFEDIGEIKKKDGTYRNSSLHYGSGYRHNYWFTFYTCDKQAYQEKIDKLYKDATNQYLQKITGDKYFTYL